jgi:hypothetical protein
VLLAFRRISDREVVVVTLAVDRPVGLLPAHLGRLLRRVGRDEPPRTRRSGQNGRPGSGPRRR